MKAESHLSIRTASANRHSVSYSAGTERLTLTKLKAAMRWLSLARIPKVEARRIRCGESGDEVVPKSASITVTFHASTRLLETYVSSYGRYSRAADTCAAIIPMGNSIFEASVRFFFSGIDVCQRFARGFIKLHQNSRADARLSHGRIGELVRATSIGTYTMTR
jgi:hypothetical protein